MTTNKPQGAFARLMASGNTGANTKKEDKATAPTPKTRRNTENNTVSHIDCNITILQSDIEQLRTPTYSVATYRLCDEDIEWVRDAAYTLSKEMKPRKVAQADLVRLAFKLLEKTLEVNREEVVAILKAIK